MTEDDHQANVIVRCDMMRRRYMVDEERDISAMDYLHHIPNGGWRAKKTANALKRAGAKAGVPDLCLPVPRGTFHGLYIEMKALDGRATDKQKKWMHMLNAQGYLAGVAFGDEQAVKVIVDYMARGPFMLGHNGGPPLMGDSNAVT